MAKISRTAIYLALWFAPLLIHAATLSISPASGTYEVGDRLTVRVLVSSSQPINAISGQVIFPTSLFTVESVSKSGSLLNFWVTEPNFSKTAGALEFEGVTLGGFPGGSATVVTANLKAVKAGTGTITFKSGQVLANDGQGTDVTDGTTGATYSVVPAKEPKTEAPPAPTPEPPQAEPTLDSPEIVLTTKYGEQAVSGTSNYAQSEVLLTFTSQGGVKVFITGLTDRDGGFILLVPKTLKRGTYKVTAIVIKRDFSNSHPSNEIIVKIGNFFSDASLEVKVSLILLILIIIYLIYRTHDHFKNKDNIRENLVREAKEAEKALYDSFNIIRTNISSPQNINKEIDDAEKKIEKEIKDIEKL